MSALSQKVLVLNKSWVAIDVISLEEAIKNVAGSYNEAPRAKIIDVVNDFRICTWEDWTNDPDLRPADGEAGIRSANTIFRIPEVIQFNSYNKTRTSKVHYNRRTIYLRDQHTCQYCGKKKITSELSLDHVKPRCQGGLTTWENIVVACTDCNAKKAGRTPQQAGMALLKKPVKPKYNFVTGDTHIKSWEQFLGEAYYNTELDNDNK